MQHFKQTWHLLQISGPLDEELAAALSESVSVIGWRPERNVLSSLFQRDEFGTAERRSPSYELRSFPMMPGYARHPVSAIARIGSSLNRLLQASTETANHDVLVCTTPYMAPVAERWPGPVVYWLTDRIASYPSASGIDVVALDRRMCAAADLICPNSERLHQYLRNAGGDPQRLIVLPNATRAQNLLPMPALEKPDLPDAISHRQRPVAGVIGNMGANIDWPMLLAVLRATPWLTWVFVGPVQDDIPDATQRAARQEVMYCRNACFTGAKPYGELVHYARSFDVAVLPYRLCEPTYSGSSTRFYEHLAACRPMLATHGFAELLKKQPLLKLVETAQQMVDQLSALRASGFSDGWEALRWHESQHNTWQHRAQTMQAALAQRLQRSADEENATVYA